MGLGIGRLATTVRKRVLAKVSHRHQLNHKGGGTLDVVDVGSVGGLPEPWYSNQHHIRFLLNFEPNEPQKRTANSLTLDVALWENDEVRPFYIYKGFQSSGSSLFEQNTEFVRAEFDELKQRGPATLAETWFDRSALVRTTKLRCRALDAVLRDDVPGAKPHFIKIDAQGAEYNILRGAADTLRSSCLGLHLELFTLPLYKDIRLAPEIEAFLADFGFRLAKKFPAHGSFDSQNDCLFLRDTPDDDQGRLATIRGIYGLDA